MKNTLESWQQLVEASRTRYALYGLVALAFAALSIITVSLKDRFDFFVNDSPQYYVYLPSLIIDGDLDCANQIECTPFVRNFNYRYPVGFALTLLPSFMIAHPVSIVAHSLTGSALFAPNAFSLIYQVVHLVLVLGLGLATFVMLDRLMGKRFHLSGRAIFLAVVTFWVGSHYAYYYFREPMMIHVMGCFWVVAHIVLIDRLVTDLPERGLRGGFVFLAVFTAAMAVVCRPTNAFLITFDIYLLAEMVRHRQLARLIYLFPAVLLGLLPIFLQMAFWQVTAHKLIHYSYHRQTFQYWNNPKLWQTLFSSRHGLLFWSPVIIGSVVGLVWHGVKHKGIREPLLVCLIVSFVMLWYANSSWHGWWFGDAFGGRAFLELSGLFVIGLAFLFEYLARAPRYCRWPAYCGLGLAVSYNYILMFLYMSHRISRSKALLG